MIHTPAARPSVLALVTIVFLPFAADAQGRRPDYARAEQFLGANMEKRIFRATIDVRWLKDGNRFWYRVKTPVGDEFHLVDPTLNTKRPVFENARLASAM